jgi:nitrite reductase/ring-hydroxylating ferredoxin subunit
MMLAHVSGKRVVIARAEDGYVAFDDRCSHKGGVSSPILFVEEWIKATFNDLSSHQ